MKRRDFITWLLAGFVAAGLGWTRLGLKPAAASSSRFPKPGKKDRCPVCGMFAYKYPRWAAGFVFKNGKRYFHCCPKCMLHNLNHIAKYQPGETRENLELIWVTEYYTTRKMVARDILFVSGTHLVGPILTVREPFGVWGGLSEDERHALLEGRIPRRRKARSIG